MVEGLFKNILFKRDLWYKYIIKYYLIHKLINSSFNIYWRLSSLIDYKYPHHIEMSLLSILTDFTDNIVVSRDLVSIKYTEPNLMEYSESEGVNQ